MVKESIFAHTKGGKQRKIIFWGGTLQCVSLREYLPEGLKLAAIFDNNPKVESPFDDVPLYHGKRGFYEWKSTLAKDEEIYFAVAIAGALGRDRCEIGDFLSREGLKPFNIIAPSAIISPSIKIGVGVQIMAGAIVDARAKIGDYTILNLGAIVAHDCKIGRGVHLAVGVHIAGCNVIDDFSTVWTGASILPRLHIEKNSVVGMGSVVRHNIAENSVVWGNPAMFGKNNLSGDRAVD